MVILRSYHNISRMHWSWENEYNSQKNPWSVEYLALLYWSLPYLPDHLVCTLEDLQGENSRLAGPGLSVQTTPHDWHDLLELPFISLPICQAGVLTYPFTKTWFYPLLQFLPSLFILFYSFPEVEIFTTTSSNFLPPLQQVCYLLHFGWLLYFSGLYETKLWSFWSFTVTLVLPQKSGQTPWNLPLRTKNWQVPLVNNYASTGKASPVTLPTSFLSGPRTKVILNSVLP